MVCSGTRREWKDQVPISTEGVRERREVWVVRVEVVDGMRGGEGEILLDFGGFGSVSDWGVRRRGDVSLTSC